MNYKYIMNKEKHKAFTRVAAKRVTNILNDIRLLKNCANRNNYDYSKTEVSKMFNEINRSLRDCKMEYENKLDNKEQGFKF